MGGNLDSGCVFESASGVRSKRGLFLAWPDQRRPARRLGVSSVLEKGRSRFGDHGHVGLAGHDDRHPAFAQAGLEQRVLDESRRDGNLLALVHLDWVGRHDWLSMAGT